MQHVLLVTAGALLSFGSVAVHSSSAPPEHDRYTSRNWITHELPLLPRAAPAPSIIASSDITEGPCAGLDESAKMNCYCEQMGLRFEKEVGCVMAYTEGDDSDVPPTKTPTPTPTEYYEDPVPP